MRSLAIALLAAAIPTAAPADAAAARPVRVEDVAQVRQIPQTAISPDGKHVAFVVNEPSVADNKTVSRLMLDTSTVTVQDRIVDLEWTPTGDLSFIAALDGADEVWTVSRFGGQPRKLFSSPAAAVPIGGERLPFFDATTPQHDSKVLRYVWSHDGKQVLYTTPALVTPSSVVYDDKTMGIQSYVSGLYGTPRAGIWVYDTVSRKSRHVYDLDLGAQGFMGPGIRWSPGDERIEMSFGGKFTVLDARTGKILDVPPTQQPPPPVVNTQDELTAWSYAGQRAAAVRENRVTAPRVVIIDGQNMRDVYNPNTAFDSIQVQQPVPAEWTDVHGHKAGGFQIVPPDCRKTRCPAIVITHGHDALRNVFMSDTFEWEFPSQVFAARGYVVLGVAESDVPPNSPGADWPATLQNMLDPVAVVEAAVKSGVDGGYIDPRRVGIAGYSRGAEVAQLAISHSTVFKAASTGEGGNGSVAYWLFGAQNPDAAKTAEQIFGGSPVDPQATAKWRDYAVDMRADQVNAPLLTQGAEGNSVANMELRAYLKARDVPTEMVTFPGETHVFNQVGDRAAAMRHSLDWFDYWLLDRKDADPAKHDQYVRWDAMRAAWKH